MTSSLPLLVLALAAGRDPAFEQKLSRQFEAAQPGLGATFDKATDALDHGQLDEAALGFEQLTRQAPQVSAGFRRLATVRSHQGRHDEAVAQATTAQQLEPGPLSDASLAYVVARRKGPGDLEQADRLTAQALRQSAQGSDDWALAKELSCQIAFATNRRELGINCAESLLMSSDSPAANLLGIEGAARRGDFALARARLDKARVALDPDEARRIEGLLDESEPMTSRWGPTLGVLGVGWLGLFLAMAGLGLVLSTLTLLAARRLATQKQQLHASRATGLLRGVYRAVLAIGSVFYYLSLPLVALAVIGVFGGLVYLCFAVGRIPIKLVLIAVVVGGASLVALVKSLFVRASEADPGLKLDWSKAPQLKALIDEVAQRVGTRTVDSLFITPGTDLAVFERGSYLKKLRGEGERCLIVGRGVLDGFQRRAFQSVLAHEFGHFSNQDTAGGGMALVGRRSLMRMGIALAQSGAAGWYNPAWLFFRAYYAVYLRISQGASRLQEVLADRVSIFTYGSAAFVSGYRHVIAQSVRFDSHVDRTLKEVIEHNLPLANLYRFTPQSAEPSEDLDSAVTKALEQAPGPYDSHPSSKDRLAWAAALDVQQPADPRDSELVLTAFDDLDSLEHDVTELVRTTMAVNHDIFIKTEAAKGELAPGP